MTTATFADYYDIHGVPRSATAMFMVGAGLIGSAWRLCHLGQRSHGSAGMERWEW